jgi:CheY-like chemotaxis protein
MGNRLLLADDSITIQKVVAIIFANEEFELTVVDNGIAALQKAREVRPDVMLVDALMPGKSGYEVCAEIRRDPSLSGTPILLLIGAFEPFDEEKARDCGADASITKPFESQQLIDRVKELLELGQSRAAAPAPAAAAAPAAPLPSASEAEELWGDLSSFDTMPPVAAPAAPVAKPVPAAPVTPAPFAQAEPVAPRAFTAPAAPAPVAPAAPAPVAPAAPAYAAPQPAPAAAPKRPAAAIIPEETFVEASYEDDLWGAFELEDTQKTAAAPAAAFGVLEGEPEFEAEEFFSFEEESEAIEETGPALDFGDPFARPAQQPSAEELFSFGEETPPSAASLTQPDPFSFPVEEPFSFEPEADATPLFGAEPEPVVPVAPSAPVLQSAPTPVQAAAQPGSFTLSEADLIAALSKISREVIERIVWEVVPDLAEVLVKEEIRKLKAGIKG